MAVVWIVLTLAAAGFLGWPVTAGVLRLARESDVRAAKRSKSDRRPPAPAADRELDPAAADPAADQEFDPAGTESAVGSGTMTDDGTEIMRGGRMIGVLERLAVALAILGGQPVAIAYIVAVKGLGRYAELKKTPAASERFIIGTLASMLWAAAVAAAAKWLLPL
ncbi:MAG: hypothetical protein ACHP7K_09265 [Actinomycetales bacterium]